jgi:hypothetical protein
MGSSGFEDGVRNAARSGADDDTLGAIVGSIAEALWGVLERCGMFRSIVGCSGADEAEGPLVSPCRDEVGG